MPSSPEKRKIQSALYREKNREVLLAKAKVKRDERAIAAGRIPGKKGNPNPRGTRRPYEGITHEQAAERFRNNPDDPRHGTTNGYGNLKCRCPFCTQANSKAHHEYMIKRRERKALARLHAMLSS